MYSCRYLRLMRGRASQSEYSAPASLVAVRYMGSNEMVAGRNPARPELGILELLLMDVYYCLCEPMPSTSEICPKFL